MTERLYINSPLFPTKEKLVIVINGSGGSGKDTLCELASKHYKCRNISSIDPIKEMAKVAGWGGEKTAPARKMLADLKSIITEYNDYPTRHVLAQYREFEQSDDDILFVHIREPGEIRKFLDRLKPSKDVLLRDFEVLVRRSAVPSILGNDADDGVANFPYDMIFVNDDPIDVAEDKFMKLVVETAIKFYGLSMRRKNTNDDTTTHNI